MHLNLKLKCSIWAPMQGTLHTVGTGPFADPPLTAAFQHMYHLDAGFCGILGAVRPNGLTGLVDKHARGILRTLSAS